MWYFCATAVKDHLTAQYPGIRVTVTLFQWMKTVVKVGSINDDSSLHSSSCCFISKKYQSISQNIKLLDFLNIRNMRTFCLVLLLLSVCSRPDLISGKSVQEEKISSSEEILTIKHLPFLRTEDEIKNVIFASDPSPDTPTDSTPSDTSPTTDGGNSSNDDGDDDDYSFGSVNDQWYIICVIFIAYFFGWLIICTMLDCCQIGSSIVNKIGRSASLAYESFPDTEKMEASGKKSPRSEKSEVTNSTPKTIVVTPTAVKTSEDIPVAETTAVEVKNIPDSKFTYSSPFLKRLLDKRLYFGSAGVFFPNGFFIGLPYIRCCQFFRLPVGLVVSLNLFTSAF